MKRHGFGIADWSVVAIVLILGVIMIGAGLTYVDHKSGQVSQKKELFYMEQIKGEVVDAPCATASRGVFELNAIKNKKFNCIIPRSTLYLRFIPGDKSKQMLQGVDTSVKITPKNNGVSIGSHSKSKRGETYRILVYNRQTGEKAPATLSVVG